ncbi:hypothetical protein QJS10_CPB14g01333 [Acorus calamus]|uniref:Uncharacterized protein n=1 Tax=Acorus calamus TaxID=4465 RepID=A0AAV9DDW6_ACOCL|nr:hypothetical protein QJS10_CPB14g01333 [Acorus calamus]
MLLLFIVVIQPAMAARVTIPTDAKPERTSEVSDAELDQQKGSIMYRSLLQSTPSVPSYRALDPQPVCSTRGGSYIKHCFSAPAPPGSP